MGTSWTLLRSAAATAALAGSLVLAASGASANANPGGKQECSGVGGGVVIYGGDVSNNTTINAGANGGTAIGDASGGDQNLAIPGEGPAFAGNGGSTDAAANGGAVGMGDVNSGGNAGNAIGVGDTVGSGDPCGAPAVQIDAGTVSNNTTVNVSANGGTAIADASGGDNNIAVNGSAGNGGTVSTGAGVASAGNGGVANAQANGGAVSIGDVNSGGNAGNAIGVGNTTQGSAPICCAPNPKPGPVAAPSKPGKPAGGGQPVLAAPTGKVAKEGKAPKVAKLPSTGSGFVADDVALRSALLAVAAASTAGLAVGTLRRRTR